ncbi:3-hydroxyacyl-CoA dehydrogenase NAD-binding domain-containing protein [Pedobacter sp. P351]|uniref:3-hydroxyacyl-CoA dehydrogenase NAD-binding domain-containing protein n=1 Tax=Pedobacter superstes TaxID=3133441 RepID=UPI0030A0B970
MKIAVIGSGTMGNGIAHTFAQFGHKVCLVDTSEEALIKGIETITRNLDRQLTKGNITDSEKASTLNNIQTFPDLKSAVANTDLVIEAATENLNIKLNLFKSLDNYCAKETILASNTSSISISQIASATNRADKVIGMHFMNPVPLMKLVEVIRGKETSDETTRIVMDTAIQLDKIPVEVNDAPGFVANRILMPMINEAIITLKEGVAGVEEIDTVMKLGMSHPMGPLQLADYIGLDVCLAIMNVMYEGFKNTKYEPSSLLKEMVEEGQMGIKSGVGFYQYIIGSKEFIVAPRFKKQ